MTAPCIGCGLTSTRVVLVTPDADIDGPPVCRGCLSECERERDELRGQLRRLTMRFGQDSARAMMGRRVGRYFGNGTFVPLARRAVA